jgi:hypothetical protein
MRKVKSFSLTTWIKDEPENVGHVFKRKKGGIKDEKKQFLKD